MPNTFPIVNNIWPKSLAQTENKRVLTLTSLETSSNPLAPDLLEITITPNLGSNNTQWKAGFTCLDDFICGDCDFEDYPDNLPAIKQIRLKKLYGCDAQRIELQISGCLGGGDWITTGNPLTTLNGSLIGAYKGVPSATSTIYDNYTPLEPIASCGFGNSGISNTCAPPSNNPVTFTKSVGSIKIEFNNISDYNFYKTNLIFRANQLIGQSPAITTTPVVCTGTPPIPQLLQYYRYMELRIPIQGPNVNCGDNSYLYRYSFHINDYFNITYTETPASNYWAIDIPQSLMVDCYPPTNCDACYGAVSGVGGLISQYNNAISNSGPNIGATGFPIFTTNVGARYTTAFTGYYMANYIQSLAGTGSKCGVMGGNTNQFSWYNTVTMPFIPNPSTPGTWTNLTTLSASLPCPLTPYTPIFHPSVPTNNGGFASVTFYSQYKFLSLSSSFNYNFNGGQSTNDFELYSLVGLTAPTGSNNNPYICAQYPSNLIFSHIGGVSTIVQPNFFINGAPTVIIDP